MLLHPAEGALDAAFRRGKLHVDAEVASILARLRRARVVCSDETSVRVDGRICWNWVFENDEVVLHNRVEQIPVTEPLTASGRPGGETGGE